MSYIEKIDIIKAILKNQHESVRITRMSDKRKSSSGSKTVKKPRSKKYDSPAYIKKARAKHGNRYDYSEVKYCGAHSKVKIICRRHGRFLREASSHLQGHGCKKCTSVKKQEVLKKIL